MGEGGSGFGCCQCSDETKACESGVSGFQCLDMSNGRDPMIWQSCGAAVIGCFCYKGAQKSLIDCTCRPIFSKYQSLCCDYRCALPPTAETVPFGIACCGVMLTGA